MHNDSPVFFVPTRQRVDVSITIYVRILYGKRIIARQGFNTR